MRRVEGHYFALGSRLESVLLTYHVPIRIVFVFSRFRALRLLFVIRLAGPRIRAIVFLGSILGSPDFGGVPSFQKRREPSWGFEASAICGHKLEVLQLKPLWSKVEVLGFEIERFGV